MERLTDCIKNGMHLTDCDDDGFCNHCGYQDDSDEQEQVENDYCCDNCGGGFAKEEMDFDVNDQDLCKNCNYKSFNDFPYGNDEE